MRSIFLLLFLFIESSGFAQLLKLSEKDILDHKVREVRIINRNDNSGDSELQNRIMELYRYNEAGKIIYKYSFNVDVIYTIDSTVFVYDERGNKSKEVNYYIDYPIGAKQNKFVKDMEAKVDTTITTHTFFYDTKNQLIKTNTEKFGKLYERQINIYDTLGRTIKEKSRNFSLPKQNDYDREYIYDEKGQLIYTKSIYPVDGNRTEEKKYTYDTNGNKTQSDVIGKWLNSTTTYIYDSKNHLLQTNEKGINGWSGKFSTTCDYSYDQKGNLIEKKRYNAKEILFWEKFEYNKRNLLTNNMWLDEKGKPTSSLIYVYSFFE